MGWRSVGVGVGWEEGEERWSGGGGEAATFRVDLADPAGQGGIVIKISILS